MTTDEAHPAWCSPQHCYRTEEKVRVHEQAPARWEDDTAGLRVRFERRLLDPGDDDTTYLELRLRKLKSLHHADGAALDHAFTVLSSGIAMAAAILLALAAWLSTNGRAVRIAFAVMVYEVFLLVERSSPIRPRRGS